jgi:hypothetical protein
LISCATTQEVKTEGTTFFAKGSDAETSALGGKCGRPQ